LMSSIDPRSLQLALAEEVSNVAGARPREFLDLIFWDFVEYSISWYLSRPCQPAGLVRGRATGFFLSVRCLSRLETESTGRWGIGAPLLMCMADLGRSFRLPARPAPAVGSWCQRSNSNEADRGPRAPSPDICVVSWLWYAYPSLLRRRLVRPHPVKALFEWTATSRLVPSTGVRRRQRITSFWASPSHWPARGVVVRAVLAREHSCRVPGEAEPGEVRGPRPVD
jgi:hypothetical protein